MIPTFFIAGKKLFGRVDQVAGVSYVATEFVHLFFVPLIPLTSYLVRDGSENINSFRGAEIRMSLKSVLAAYLRAFLILSVLYQLYRMVRFGSYHPLLILKCAAFIALYFLSRKLLRANREHESALAAQGGVNQRLAGERNAATSAVEGGVKAGTGAASTPSVQCSFCGRFKEQVSRMITGPSVNICRDCVAYLGQSSQTDHVAKEQNVTCNFCHELRPETMTMAHRQGTRICGECLSLCVEILNTPPEKSPA